MKKVLLLIFGITISIVIIILILPFTIDLNKYHDRIIGLIKPHVINDVNFSGIKLTILGGLGAEIDNFNISGSKDSPKENLLKIKRIKVNIEILPLLKKQIKIRKIILDKPEINIVKEPDGTYNIKNVLVKKPRGKEAPEIPGRFKGLIKKIEIRGGKIIYAPDKPEYGNQPVIIQKIDMNAKNVSTFKPIAFNLSASLMNEGSKNLKATGSFGPINETKEIIATPVIIRLNLEKINLSLLPVRSSVFSSGYASMESEISGETLQTVSIKTSVQISGIKETSGNSNVPDIKAFFLILFDYARKQIQIKSSTIESGADKCSLSGNIINFSSKPAWDVSVSSHGINIYPLISSIPNLSAKMPSKLRMKGPLSFTANSSGTKEAFQIAAFADMKAMLINWGETFSKPQGVQASFSTKTDIYKNITNIRTFNLTFDNIITDGSGDIIKKGKSSVYDIQFKSTPAALSRLSRYVPVIAIYNTSGTAVMRGNIKGEKNTLKINTSTAFPSIDFEIKDKSSTGKDRAKPTKPFKGRFTKAGLDLNILKKDKTLEAAGIFKADEGHLLDLPCKNLNAAFSYASDMFILKSLNMKMFKGSADMNASYNLKNKQWAAFPSLENLQAGNVLGAFSSFKDVFTGNLSGKASASGIAGKPTLENLNAAASMHIEKGEWLNFNLSDSALSSLLIIPGFSQITGITRDRIEPYRTTKFDLLSSDTSIGKGLMKITSMQLKGLRMGSEHDSIARLSGVMNLSSRSINLKGTIALPKKTSAKLIDSVSAFKSLKDNNGRVTLPLTITGTIQKPSPSVDTNAFKKALADFFSKKAVEKGMEKLKEKTGIAIPKDTDEKVQKLIEGIFDK